MPGCRRRTSRNGILDGRVSRVPTAAVVSAQGSPAPRVRAAARRADKAAAAGGTEWVADVGLTAQSPDGTRRVVDLDNRSRGSVRWIQSDPFGDPANADIMARISEPPPCARPKD